MKLISCYIENFGGLSQYSLEFDRGVTVIREANGFGKTTLAEFLRAMLYGFPRKAKTLDKSRRQKYTPWNGGKFGGNLIFEHEGKQYRLERTFGATPRGDSFNLIDLETGKKSDRFSEDIGLELFQLDGDSFERSTYMPQLHDTSTLTTTGIQAKLGDLVEDTGDINNFDKAMQTLRAKRSGFIPYRGSGGTVAEATARISLLQKELDRAEARKAELEQCAGEIEATEAQLARKKSEIEAARQQWERSSKAAHARQRFEELTAQHKTAVLVLDTLRSAYPAGIPGETKIEEARGLANRLAVLDAQPITTQADLDAQEILNIHGPRFENHVPNQEELESARQKLDDCTALHLQAKNTGLTTGEQKQYEELHAAFESGMLNEQTLDELAEQNRALLRQRGALEQLTVSEDDRKRMQELSVIFARGIPGEDAIRQHRHGLEQCTALRQENEKLLAQADTPEKQNRILPILGCIAIALGIALLVLQSLVPGGAALAVGIGLLAAGLLLNSKNRREHAETIRASIEKNEASIHAIEVEASAFANAFTRNADLNAALDEIQRLREETLSLQKKLQELKQQRTAQEELAQQTEESLRRYLGSAADFDLAISDLRLARSRYLELRGRKAAADEEAARLNTQSDALQKELTAFFAPYFPDVRPERFGESLAALQRDRDAYLRAKEQTARWTERKSRHDREVQECTAALDDFFARFALTRGPDVHRQLQQLYDDGKAQAQAAGQEQQLTAQLKQFPEVPEAATDPDVLKQEEQQLSEVYTALTETLLNQRQQRQPLQEQVDRIPELTDELEYWQERQRTHRQKAETLDDTMDFLEKARESLTTSYLGPIRESFAGYLAQLSGGQEDQVFISPDLEVQLERLGEARELAYFSAGQMDVVMLCMRLALVDALFPEVKPFVILDDPFVNLDDAHTAEALKLLTKLGRDRQIIYLTCNSSRSI